MEFINSRWFESQNRFSIPTSISHTLQVFLEPFSRVLGQATSKKVLLAVAQSDARHLSCLHRLGVVLGITEWVKDYQRKWNESQSHNGVSRIAPLEQIKVGRRQKSQITQINMLFLYEVHLANVMHLIKPFVCLKFCFFCFCLHVFQRYLALDI